MLRLKKLIIIIPLVVVLLIPTLIVSSSAASISLSNKISVFDPRSCIGYPVTSDTYWTPDSNIRMRSNLDSNSFQINLYNDTYSDYYRIVYFDLVLPRSNYFYNLSVSFDCSSEYDMANFIPGTNGSEIYSDNGDSVGYFSLSSQLPIGYLNISNVKGGQVIHCSFGFQQMNVLSSVLLTFSIVNFEMVSNDEDFSSSYNIYQKTSINDVLSFNGVPSSTNDTFFSDDSLPANYFSTNHTVTGGLNPFPSLSKFSVDVTSGSNYFRFRKSPYSSTESTCKTLLLESKFNFGYGGENIVFNSQRYYNFDFDIKLSNQVQIGYGFNLSEVRLVFDTVPGNYSNYSVYDYVFYPISTATRQVSGNLESICSFDFVVSGLVLNKYNFTGFQFVFKSDTPKYYYATMSLSSMFSIRCMNSTFSSDDANNYNSTFIDVENLYVNPNLPSVNSNNDLSSFGDQLSKLEGQYSLDNSDFFEISKSSTDFLHYLTSNGAFVGVSNFISRFFSENQIIYLFIVYGLTLGICFFAIGRGKS